MAEIKESIAAIAGYASQVEALSDDDVFAKITSLVEKNTKLSAELAKEKAAATDRVNTLEGELNAIKSERDARVKEKQKLRRSLRR